MELFDFIIKFILIVLCTFSVSSMILFSPGPEEFREGWIKFFSKFKGIFKKPMYLLICQLCISFWIAISFSLLIIGYINLLSLLVVAFSSAGLSWMFGAITNACLYAKYYFETKANLLRKENDNKKKDDVL